jgi:hypothetical protein
MPESLARGSVQCDEIAFRIAGEHKVAGSGQHTRPRWGGVAKFPFELSRREIEGAKSTLVRFAVGRRKIRTAVVRMASLVGLRSGAEDVTLLAGVDVEESGLRVETG